MCNYKYLSNGVNINMNIVLIKKQVLNYFKEFMTVQVESFLIDYTALFLIFLAILYLIRPMYLSAKNYCIG